MKNKADPGPNADKCAYNVSFQFCMHVARYSRNELQREMRYGMPYLIVSDIVHGDKCPPERVEVQPRVTYCGFYIPAPKCLRETTKADLCANLLACENLRHDGQPPHLHAHKGHRHKKHYKDGKSIERRKRCLKDATKDFHPWCCDANNL